MILHIGNSFLHNVGILNTDSHPIVDHHTTCVAEEFIKILNVQALGEGEYVVKIIEFRFIPFPLCEKRVHEIIVQDAEGVQRGLFSVQPVTDVFYGGFCRLTVSVPDGGFETVQVIFFNQAGVILLGCVGKADDFAVVQKQMVVKGRIGFQVSAGAFFKGAVVIADRHDIVRAIFLADGEKAVQKAFDFFLLVGKQQEQILVIADQVDAEAICPAFARDGLQHGRICPVFVAEFAALGQSDKVEFVINVQAAFLSGGNGFLTGGIAAADKITDETGFFQGEGFLFRIPVAGHQKLDSIFNAVQIVMGFLVQKQIHPANPAHDAAGGKCDGKGCGNGTDQYDQGDSPLLSHDLIMKDGHGLQASVEDSAVSGLDAQQIPAAIQTYSFRTIGAV